MTAPLAVLYEHPRWFEPLLAALEQRGIETERVDARNLAFDPSSSTTPAELIFNRVAMSAPQRDQEHGIFHAMAVLDHWRSPTSGGLYPSHWHLSVPAAQLSVDILPWLADQENRLSFAYWEGAVRITSIATTGGGAAVTGNGFIEMTGYATSIAGRF